MARPAKKVAKPAPKPGAEPEGFALRIVVDPSIDTPAYYMNHVEAVVGEHDITLFFTRLPSKPGRDTLEEAQETGEIVVEPEFQVILPPTILPGLIRALEKTRDNHETVNRELRKLKDD